MHIPHSPSPIRKLFRTTLLYMLYAVIHTQDSRRVLKCDVQSEDFDTNMFPKNFLWPQYKIIYLDHRQLHLMTQYSPYMKTDRSFNMISNPKHLQYTMQSETHSCHWGFSPSLRSLTYLCLGDPHHKDTFF